MGVMLLIVAGMVLIRPATDAVAYLSSIGQAPMRFELATNTGALSVWKPLRLVAPTATNGSIPAAGAETLANVTNQTVLNTPSLSAKNTNVIRAVSVPVADPGENTTSEISPVPVILPFSADGSSNPMMLQELAGYFQPVPGVNGTNGTAVLLPVKIGFVPPLPAIPAKSQAIYKTQ